METCGSGVQLSCAQEVGIGVREIDLNSIGSDLTKYTKTSVNVASSGTLETGLYEVELSGGGGGGGGNKHNEGWGGLGGAGELKKKVLLVMSPLNYTATIGKGGSGGGAQGAYANAGSGSAGGNTTLEIGDSFSITAFGGGGGSGGTDNDGSDGKPGGGVGGGASGGHCGKSIRGNVWADSIRSGKSGSNGWLKIYKYN